MPKQRAASASHDRAWACRQVVEGFQEYWQAADRHLRAGQDVALERAPGFLAGCRSARVKLARAFYHPDRVARFAALGSEAAQDLVGPWLDTAARYAIREAQECGETIRGAKWTRFLRTLAHGEYVVAVTTGTHRGRPRAAPIVQRLPDPDVLYGDLYEICAGGASCASLLTVWKSTGEAFRPSERRSAVAGIRSEIISVARAEAGDVEDWVCSFNFPREEVIEVEVVDTKA